MIDGKSVLGLIAARGGSKGIPGKNILKVNGRPLIQWSIDSARKSRYIDRLILSSDDRAIIEVAKSAGCEAPFLRDAALATDEASSIDVVVDALNRVPGYDIVVLLQPTSPLRRASHVSDAVGLLRRTNADSVVTVVEGPRPRSPDYVMRIEAGRLVPFLADGARVTRRQDARPAYSRDGTVYACWRATLERFGTLYGERCQPLVIEASESLSIDTLDDWAEAERRILRPCRPT